jgi:hypothetical protein
MTTTGEVLLAPEWLKPGAIVPVTPETVRVLLDAVRALTAPKGNATQEGVFVGRVFVDQLTGQRSIVPGGDIAKIVDMTRVYAAASNKEVER